VNWPRALVACALVLVAGSCGGSHKGHAEVDVSHASGVQSEVAVAVDPRRRRCPLCVESRPRRPRLIAQAVSTEYGDYEGLAVAHGVAHPVWTDSRKASARQEEIYTTALPERLFGR
jgi:hypothetical protein